MQRIETKILAQLTDASNERNVYLHGFFLAREIFWQRLENLYGLILLHCSRQNNVIDFGGGSGVFSLPLSNFFRQVDIIDIDTSDAENIKKHFQLPNVEILKQDIRGAGELKKYDVVIAADTLEHFENLNEPLHFINKVLAKDGKLFVSLPTENWLYMLGRLLVGKSKPKDHYHSSNQVIDFFKNNNFEVVESRYSPVFIKMRFPLFYIAVLQKYVS